MSLTITPGTIVSDGHVVLLPPGLTGQVTVGDGTVYDLGPAAQIAVEVDSHEHAKELGLAASKMAGDDPALPDVTYDEKQSATNMKKV